MIAHGPLRRVAPILIVCLVGAHVSTANAQTLSAQLGGWVYIDSNNDGQLAWANQPNPEYALGGVQIDLFYNNGPTPLTSQLTDNFGRYFFDNLPPGTYTLRQVHPFEFLDGKDTLGTILNPVPPGSSAGVASNDAFTNIVLPAGAHGDFYLFGERGLLPQYITKRLLLNSTPPLEFAIPEPGAATLILAAGGCSSLRRSRRR